MGLLGISSLLAAEQPVFTSWYDVSHAMGFRVWVRNSIKNHSLTLLDN